MEEGEKGVDDGIQTMYRWSFETDLAGPGGAVDALRAAQHHVTITNGQHSPHHPAPQDAEEPVTQRA